MKFQAVGIRHLAHVWVSCFIKSQIGNGFNGYPFKIQQTAIDANFNLNMLQLNDELRLFEWKEKKIIKSIPFSISLLAAICFSAFNVIVQFQFRVQRKPHQWLQKLFFLLCLHFWSRSEWKTDKTKYIRFYFFLRSLHVS